LLTGNHRLPTEKNYHNGEFDKNEDDANYDSPDDEEEDFDALDIFKVKYRIVNRHQVRVTFKTNNDARSVVRYGVDKNIKKHKKEMKSLTAEDVIEIVKSFLPKSAPMAEILVPIIDPNSSMNQVAPQKSALDIATDELYNSVKSAIGLPGLTLEQKLEGINPSLQNLGNTITAMVRDSMGIESVSPTSNDQNLVLEAVTSLTNTVKELAQEVAIIKEKSQTPSNVVNRVPVPRSIQPQLVAQSQPQTPVNPNSVSNIVRRSVSSVLPLK